MRDFLSLRDSRQGALDVDDNLSEKGTTLHEVHSSGKISSSSILTVERGGACPLSVDGAALWLVRTHSHSREVQVTRAAVGTALYFKY